MYPTSVRPADEMERVMQLYGNILYRLCLVMLGNASDAEEAVQETIIRYFQKAPAFADAEHEKAWLLKVAANKCRDMLRFRSTHPQLDLESLPEIPVEKSESGILEALMTLPEKYKLVLILYYVEEYRVGQIAEIIGRTPSAVKMRLQKGRKLLEETYRKEYL